jgi:hypothetical protein
MVVLSSAAAIAQDISTSFDLAYCSKYVWRGMPVNSEPVLQPSLTVSHSSGLSFNLWGSYDLTVNNGNKDRFTEIDYTLSYSWKPASTAYSAGILRYEFPNTAFAKTHEVYLSASFDAPYAPVLAINYDFDQADGLYANFGVGSTCKLGIDETAKQVNLSAKLGMATGNYNKFYFAGHTEAAFTDIYLGASLPLTAGKVTVTPLVAYSSILDGGLRDAYSRPDNLMFCVTASTPL